MPFLTAYHASKFAIEGFTESLRQELADFNINVILIEPGDISSNFMNNGKTAKGFEPDKSPYAKMVQQVFQGYESISAYSSHPSKVAQSILNVINSPNPEIRNPVGKDAVSTETRIQTNLIRGILRKAVEHFLNYQIKCFFYSIGEMT